MAQTLAQLTKQIDRLQKEAEAMRQAELKGVIDRIKVAIDHYGLTPDQLGFGKAVAKGAKSATLSAKGNGKPALPRFARDAGEVWSGRGPRPRWLREALAHGRSLEEFSTDPHKRASKAAPVLNQGDAVAEVQPQAKPNASVKRAKVSTKKGGGDVKPASPASEGAPAQADASTGAAPNKSKRQAKTSAPQANRAQRSAALQATAVAVKRTPRTLTKRASPVSSTVSKAATAPGSERSGLAVPAPAGV